MSFIAVGFALVIAATALTFQTRSFVAGSTATLGRVTAWDYRKSSLRATGFVTVFTFTNAAGRTYTVRSGWASSRPSHRIGEAVTVLYPPEKPEAARIQSFQTLWLLPTVLGCSGLAAAGMGVLALRAGLSSYA